MHPSVFAQKAARYSDPPTSRVARIKGNGQEVRAALSIAESDEISEISVRVKDRAAAKIGDAFAKNNTGLEPASGAGQHDGVMGSELAGCMGLQELRKHERVFVGQIQASQLIEVRINSIALGGEF